MKLNIEENTSSILKIVCLLKVFHDAGSTALERFFAREEISMDTYYEFVYEAIQNAAPIVMDSDRLYAKYGCNADDGEVYIWGYSSATMQEYFRIARKLHRLEGCKTPENPYIAHIERRIEGIRGFDSYNFDYAFGGKRTRARLEVMWWYDFTSEIPMCLWIVRIMKLMEKELAFIKAKYRKARREKRGACHAGR